MMIHFLENLLAMSSHLLDGGAGVLFVDESVVGCVENKLPQLVRFCISILMASGTNG